MPRRSGRMLATAMLLASLAVAVPVGMTASAAPGAPPGPGTFTKITTPSGATVTHVVHGATSTFAVAGRASLDVTTVNIDCLFISGGALMSESLAKNVAVSGGGFSAVAHVSSVPPNCRLRAVPTNVSVTSDYLGSYAGPIVYTETALVVKAGTTPAALVLATESGVGLAEVTDAATCGVGFLVTIATPTMTLGGSSMENCELGLAYTDLADSAIPIRVDGHNAYLPATVHSDFSASLSLVQPRLTVKLSKIVGGVVTATESARLMRCSGSNLFPPTTTSCPHLVSTGVTFTRTTTVNAGARQVQFRDSFTSTDGAAHALRLQYEAGGPLGQSTGAAGYDFPGHGTAFKASTPGEIVTGLGSKSGSVVMASDMDAVPGDVGTDATALSWSRAPSKIQFASDPTTRRFSLDYTVTVTAHNALHLGLALSEQPTAAAVASLGQRATAAMISAPTITSPAAGATVKGKTITVKGSVAVGANGLATKVTVAGHKAHLTATATSAKYQASFTEPYGEHSITVTATDSAGNTSHRTIKVRNKR
jgi:Glucodextranase, domain B